MLVIKTGYIDNPSRFDGQSSRLPINTYWMPLYDQPPVEQSEWARNLVKCLDLNEETTIYTQSDHIMKGIKLAISLDKANASKIIAKHYNRAGHDFTVTFEQDGKIKSSLLPGFIAHITNDPPQS